MQHTNNALCVQVALGSFPNDKLKPLALHREHHVISEFERLKQKNIKFVASWSYIVTPYFFSFLFFSFLFFSFLFFSFLFFLSAGFLCVTLAVLELTLYQVALELGDQLASASRVLGLKMCATTI